jgi:hypothetical protein
MLAARFENCILLLTWLDKTHTAPTQEQYLTSLTRFEIL